MRTLSIDSRRAVLLAVMVLLLAFQRAAAQSTTVWRGLSRCVAANHPCRDEQVIYRVAAVQDTSRRVMSAARIVGADTVKMGELTLTREAGSNEWVSRLPLGVWKFQIGRDSLSGTLTVNDGTVMRRVSASPLRQR